MGKTEPGASAYTPLQFAGVTISSTFRDLKKHRDEVMAAIDGLGMHAVCMERDGARSDGDLIDSSLRMVREGAGYIGIISRRYGQVPPGTRTPKAFPLQSSSSTKRSGSGVRFCCS